MLTCRQVTELVTDYLEGRMSFGQRVSFMLHVGMCRRCRAYLAQMRMTVRVLGKMPPEPLPPDLRDELLARSRTVGPAHRAAAPRRPGVLAAFEDKVGRARGWLVGGILAIVALVVALLGAGQPALPAATWERCVLIGLGAALLPVVVLGLVVVGARDRLSAGVFVALAACGSFAGFVWLELSCPASGSTPHALAVHVGPIVVSALLGAAASWLPARTWRTGAP